MEIGLKSMLIEKISELFLLNKKNRKISVSIIDSGFLHIPEYAKIYGRNLRANHFHGNRVLSVFKALDKKYPLDLTLNLSCYDENDTYAGLLNAIQRLPVSDILSISLAWEEDKKEIYQMMKQKAKIICVPYSSDTKTPYPSSYTGVITCSYMPNELSDYSIFPNPDWKGNSYAVPAVARLLCYGKIENDENGIKINQLFSQMENYSYNSNGASRELRCSHCKRVLRTKYHTLMKEMPQNCPYCGLKMEQLPYL